MKLRRLYSNKPDVFQPINFHDGLNVIIADITDHSNDLKDTHNLGKTTVAILIDFCLLKGKISDMFLLDRRDIFNDFVFYLEVESNGGKFINIRRSVAEHSRVALMISEESIAELNEIDEPTIWDHYGIAIERAETLLDGWFGLKALGSWGYRNGLSYFLRVQNDYNDVFQLDKFKGKHVTWKPYLAHLLGFDSDIIVENYRIDDQIKQKSEEEEILRSELGGQVEERDKIEGSILVRDQEIKKLEENLDSYDFALDEKGISSKAVNEIETSIANLNVVRYSLNHRLKTINSYLKENVAFSLDELEEIYEQSRIYFGDQIKKDFSDLVNFNKHIVEDRKKYLVEDRSEIRKEISSINKQLRELSMQRAKALSLLGQGDAVQKYKELTKELIQARTELEVLRRRKASMDRIAQIRNEQRELMIASLKIRGAIEREISRPSEIYNEIRLGFDDVVSTVLDKNAIVSVRVNNNGNLDFSAEILNDEGAATRQGKGYTYAKFLCIAFDMAILRAYADKPFFHFVYHDGVFESLDDRKKLKLIGIINEYCFDYDYQHIITLIDSDLPIMPDGERYEFEDDVIILRLHDGGDDGRLFKMRAW